MAFMELELTRKGSLYSAECAKCGATLYAHEWASWDNNEDRDALKAGTFRCDQCDGTADRETFRYCGRHYAARYSAAGFLDCTEWSYGRNKRALLREVRDMYGDEG